MTTVTCSECGFTELPIIDEPCPRCGSRFPFTCAVCGVSGWAGGFEQDEEFVCPWCAQAECEGCHLQVRVQSLHSTPQGRLCSGCARHISAGSAHASVASRR